MNADLNEILEETRCKHQELKKTIEYFQTENSLLKQKCQVLRNRLFKFNNHLENNVRIFEQLADATRGVLLMSKATSLRSPVLSKKSLLNRISELKTVNMTKSNSPKPGPSTAPDLNVPQIRNVTRRKLHIEPINMEKLMEITESEIQDLDNQQVKNSSITEGIPLSTIIEEDEPSSTKEAVVKIKRLPSDVVETHLQKQHSFINSTLDETNLSMQMKPDSSSTPLKLELMLQLGLTPTERHFNFVSDRKKTRSNRVLKSPKKELLSPQSSPQKSCNVKENLSPKEKKSSRAKRKKSTPEKSSEILDTVNERGQRRARPKQLKEVSLVKKLRRS